MKVCLVLLLIILFAVCFTAQNFSVYSQVSELPDIISTAEIFVSELTIQSRPKGDVVVDLEIDPNGKVTSVKTIEGHPLLRMSTEYSASRWQFSAGTHTRKVRLTFVYPLVSMMDAEVKVLPYGLELKTTFGTPSDTIDMIPSDYKEVETRCKVHHIPLKKDKVELIYGLMGFDGDYRKARKRLFPNSNQEAYGGCVVDNPIYAEVLYCEKCRKAEMKWEEQQKKKKETPKQAERQ